MATQVASATIALRIWQDDRQDAWRCAFNDGSGEVVVSFASTAAIGEFIADRVELVLEGDLVEQQVGAGR